MITENQPAEMFLCFRPVQILCGVADIYKLTQSPIHPQLFSYAAASLISVKLAQETCLVDWAPKYFFFKKKKNKANREIEQAVACASKKKFFYIGFVTVSYSKKQTTVQQKKKVWSMINDMRNS